MGLVDELAKLQQLKESGALTDEEFSVAKQRLLHDTSEHAAITPGHAQHSPSPLVEAIDDVMEEESTLGVAANRYVSYKNNSAIISAVVFVIVAIIFAIIFSSAVSHGNAQFDQFNSSHGMPSFPGR